MKIDIFQMPGGEWVLDIKSSNGALLFLSGRSYRSEGNAKAAANRLIKNMHRARVVVR